VIIYVNHFTTDITECLWHNSSQIIVYQTQFCSISQRENIDNINKSDFHMKIQYILSGTHKICKAVNVDINVLIKL
jgi:hypothetical protein